MTKRSFYKKGIFNNLQALTDFCSADYNLRHAPASADGTPTGQTPTAIGMAPASSADGHMDDGEDDILDIEPHGGFFFGAADGAKPAKAGKSATSKAAAAKPGHKAQLPWSAQPVTPSMHAGPPAAMPRPAQPVFLTSPNAASRPAASPSQASASAAVSRPAASPSQASASSPNSVGLTTPLHGAVGGDFASLLVEAANSLAKRPQETLKAIADFVSKLKTDEVKTLKSSVVGSHKSKAEKLKDFKSITCHFSLFDTTMDILQQVEVLLANLGFAAGQGGAKKQKLSNRTSNRNRGQVDHSLSYKARA